jgi:GntR family transcriptional regulator
MRMPRITTAIPAYRQVAAYYRKRILSGRLKPGTQFPTLDDIAGAWNVSRVTASRAVAVLRTEGLVLTRHRHGTYVVDQLPTNNTDRN